MIPKIERNIPLTAARRSRGSQWRDLVASMKVGDSFVTRRTNLAYVYNLAKKMGVRLTTRTIDRKSVRVWRVRTNMVNPPAVQQEEQAAPSEVNRLANGQELHPPLSPMESWQQG
ncbi:MAG TPA: hypothetical protein VD994_14990 [Prosthecobacter sp.]|nr:hypothetical protein [Prosthecobacter sp.]